MIRDLDQYLGKVDNQGHIDLEYMVEKEAHLVVDLMEFLGEVEELTDRAEKKEVLVMTVEVGKVPVPLAEVAEGSGEPVVTLEEVEEVVVIREVEADSWEMVEVEDLVKVYLEVICCLGTRDAEEEGMDSEEAAMAAEARVEAATAAAKKIFPRMHLDKIDNPEFQMNMPLDY